MKNIIIFLSFFVFNSAKAQSDSSAIKNINTTKINRQKKIEQPKASQIVYEIHKNNLKKTNIKINLPDSSQIVKTINPEHIRSKKPILPAPTSTK